MHKRKIILISVGLILLSLVSCFMVYIILEGYSKPFNTDFITEIQVTKEGKKIQITNINEIADLKKYFEASYTNYSYPVKCTAPSDFVYFEVALIGKHETFVLSPTGDDCGYFTHGLLSFLDGHYYILSANPNDFLKHIESQYEFE